MRTIYLSILLLFCANLFAQKSVQYLKEVQPDFKIEEANNADFKPFTKDNFGLDNGTIGLKYLIRQMMVVCCTSLLHT
jgi:hypothetical protein